MTYNINHKEQQQRQDFLEALYLADGRASKDHPMHGLYTGLFNRSNPSDLLLSAHYQQWWRQNYTMPVNAKALECSVQWAQQLLQDLDFITTQETSNATKRH